ncbi:unnamed protein product [Notodromas monacha]|uniref:Beta-galactosidase n=1 Tax=Notodromas monacha TaxID=399045 RepID=A0A7R9GCP8_9CRUS|nr:unnamed protein product [Notodromas monacha]CAG0916082.1 unnamed protein product [Notodromas monacha]
MKQLDKVGGAAVPRFPCGKSGEETNGARGIAMRETYWSQMKGFSFQFVVKRSDTNIKKRELGANGQDLPTLYGYYTEGGIVSGLEEDGTQFLLNGKRIQLISGSVHYFRIHPDYWRSSLRKLKACGMNAVITYVPWNLHEPVKDVYDFGEGDNDMSLFLDLDSFLRIAREEELFVIVRPGPYICSEWDFGGLPSHGLRSVNYVAENNIFSSLLLLTFSYLLRDPEMRVRTAYPGYMDRVSEFYQRLVPILRLHQWMPGNAGPIIAAQIENEYGAFIRLSGIERDTVYLEGVRDLMINNGLDKIYFFFSDSPASTGLDDLMTANFQGSAEAQFNALEQLQPLRPLWAMELWAGWFDHWLEGAHNTFPIETTLEDLRVIFSRNGSVNFYMFQGGTNFGFLNGANSIVPTFPNYIPDTTSYDYDGCISESGDYTEKYEAVCSFMQANTINPPIALPERPLETSKMAPVAIPVSSYLTLDDLLSQNVPLYTEEKLVNMENLGTSEIDGQDYGFLLYRKTAILPAGENIITFATETRDMVTVMIDGVHQIGPLTTEDDLLGPGYWYAREPTLTVVGEDRSVTLDFLVENLGRVNYGAASVYEHQQKGLIGGNILLNGEPLSVWETRPLTFKANWIKLEQMILLGSIPRLELVRALEKHIGRERRMKAASRWHNLAQKALLESRVKELAASREAMMWSRASGTDAESVSSLTGLRHNGKDEDGDGAMTATSTTNARQEELAANLMRNALGVDSSSSGDQGQDHAQSQSSPVIGGGGGSGEGGRRSSRFEVVPTSSDAEKTAAAAAAAAASAKAKGSKEDEEASKRQQHATDLLMEFSVNKDYSATNSLPAPGQRPIKSILKKTPSFHFPAEGEDVDGSQRPSRSRAGTSVKNSPYGTMDSTRMRRAMDVWKALGRAASQLSGLDKGPYGTWTPKRVQLPLERVIDLPPEEQRRWEERELALSVDFSLVSVDPAPFQLVEKTTLLKVHSLFSLLSLKLAYVTALGKLIGVVALRDLRGAIEGVNAGHFTAPAAGTSLAEEKSEGAVIVVVEDEQHASEK